VKLLSIEDVAERLSCSRGHVYNLIARGQLDRYNIAIKGSKARVSEESVDRYIEAMAQPVKRDAS
jgi:excisionase family DNA binding protein